jgi:pectinesterase
MRVSQINKSLSPNDGTCADVYIERDGAHPDEHFVVDLARVHDRAGVRRPAFRDNCFHVSENCWRDAFCMDRRIILVALLLAALFAPSCSRFAGNLPKPDIVVSADGSGNFKTIQAAIASIPAINRERVVVFVKNGTYREKTRVDASFVTLRGQSRKGTRIEFPQVKDDFVAHPDDLGWAVINLNRANDFVLTNLTVENTASNALAHAFTIYGSTGDRTVIVDCDVVSHGADTVSLGAGGPGHFYHARCHFSGSADFVCPRGWCYVTDCSFYAYKKTAAVWHDGSFDPNMKFVLHNCRFDGATGFSLGRHHVDAQFYFLDCKFSAKIRDKPIQRVIYPLKSGPATEADIRHNADLNKQNSWGERSYFYNCHRDGGDFDWFANNLSSASGSPKPKEITAAWTFGGKWNPEKESGPTIQQLRVMRGQIAVGFSEPVTVKGKPRLKMCSGGVAKYISGTGGDTLLFELASDSGGEVCAVDLNGGAIIACEASATLRPADLSIVRGPEVHDKIIRAVSEPL